MNSMKQNAYYNHPQPGRSRRLVKALLLGLSSITVFLFTTMPADATYRDWTGAASANWSDPNNWSPTGTPQNGDALGFGSVSDSHRFVVNDLVNLTVWSLDFTHSHPRGFEEKGW